MPDLPTDGIGKALILLHDEIKSQPVRDLD
jgi:hypothetical protein